MSNTDLPSSTHETTADVFDMDAADTQDDYVGDADILDDADETVDDDDLDLDDDDDLLIEDEDDDLLDDEEI